MSYTNDWKEEMLEQQQSYFILIDGREPIVAKLTNQNSFEYYDDYNTCCIYDDLSDNVEVLAPCNYDDFLFLKRKVEEMAQLAGNRGLEIKKVCEEKFELEQENEQLKGAIRLARDVAYSSSHDSPICSLIDTVLTKTLNEVKIHED